MQAACKRCPTACFAASNCIASTCNSHRKTSLLRGEQVNVESCTSCVLTYSCCAQVDPCRCKSLPGNLLHQILDLLPPEFPFLSFFPFWFVFFFPPHPKSGNAATELFRGSVSVKVNHLSLVRGGEGREMTKPGRSPGCFDVLCFRATSRLQFPTPPWAHRQRWMEGGLSQNPSSWCARPRWPSWSNG